MTLRRCSVCDRDDVADIDHDLSEGMSLRRVISKHGRLNLSTLHRHLEHAQEREQRDSETVDEVTRVASLSDLDTDTPPTAEEWEAIVTAIALELRGWHSISLKIADALARAGHERLSPLFVATIPAVALRQAVAQRPERSAYVPQEWLANR